MQTEFIPLMFGIGEDNIDYKLLNELALVVSSGCIGIWNPTIMSAKMFDPLTKACRYSMLTASLIDGEALLYTMTHGNQV